jgi:cell division protein FtsQ
MTGNYSFTAGGEKKMERGLRRVLIFGGVVLAAELIWLFIISPCIPFSTVEVHEIPDFTRAEILAYGGIEENSSFISTNVREVQKRLAAHNLVESANVTKRFPDRLSIFLVPRQAVVVSLAEVGSKQLPLHIDRYGVIFKIGEAAQDASPENGLPVLSGLEFDQVEVNMRLPEALTGLLENVSRIAEESPELLAAISEIRVEQRAWEVLELILYPVHSSVSVRVDNNLTGDVIRYMILMLDIFESHSPKPKEIDFRLGMGSYSIKESALW